MALIATRPLANAAAERAASTRRPLTVCAIGYAESVHVATRVRWFAKRGHHVYLITESPSRFGIEGVTELVPSLDRALERRFWLRVCAASTLMNSGVRGPGHGSVRRAR